MFPGGSVRQLIEGTLYEVGDTLQTKRLGCCLAGWGRKLAAVPLNFKPVDGFFLKPIFQLRHE